jgi:hypothetical protein
LDHHPKYWGKIKFMFQTTNQGTFDLSAIHQLLNGMTLQAWIHVAYAPCATCFTARLPLDRWAVRFPLWYSHLSGWFVAHKAGDV